MLLNWCVQIVPWNLQDSEVQPILYEVHECRDAQDLCIILCGAIIYHLAHQIALLNCLLRVCQYKRPFVSFSYCLLQPLIFAVLLLRQVAILFLCCLYLILQMELLLQYKFLLLMPLQEE